MAELPLESTRSRSHKARTALFLSAMRHFEAEMRERGRRTSFRRITSGDPTDTFADALSKDLAVLKPQRVVMTEPGEWDVRVQIAAACRGADVPLEVRPDRYFLCSTAEFHRFASGRKQLRMEHFYRRMRRKHNVLMDGGMPAEGRWNFDAENRRGFGPEGPGLVPGPLSFQPDEMTLEALRDVEEALPDNPGSVCRFGWPVTPAQAQAALQDFIENRLWQFGRYQDAMWTGNPYLFHAALSASLNLKLLHPMQVIRAAEEAYRGGRAPIGSVEGFIRQVLGWREYVRGIYWYCMPQYRGLNAMGAAAELPAFYWTGETEMSCLRHVVQQTLDLGYAHHIQRLMVTGLFAMLLGVHPLQIHEWYLGMYVDAVEWVELPNTLGMSQYADGGLMSSKPYAASGRYIAGMSNYCSACRYKPLQASGRGACPFTTLYWDFLRRNEPHLRGNPRMQIQLSNLQRQSPAALNDISLRASEVRAALQAGTSPA
jgi:deoxyribodipyrimidine photolyase-related protein